MPAGGLARALTWSGKAGLRDLVILDDGTVFTTADEVVLAAAPDARGLREVGRMGSIVRSIVPSPSGAAVAVTDEDAQTVLYSGAIAKAAGGR